MTAGQLWAQLRADGLVEGEVPNQDQPASPWYVRIMLGIAGWIGALFLMGFVGAALSFVIEEAASAAIAGLICCGVAFALFRRFDGNDFVEQFGLAISLVGQILLIIALAQHLKPQDPGLYLAIAAVQAGLALAIPNFLHRLLTTSGAAVALALAINQLSLHGLSAPLLCAGLGLVWLKPRLWAVGGRLWRPIGYGLVLALLLVETFRLFGAERLFGMGSEAVPWIKLHGPALGRALTAAVLVFVALALIRREAVRPASRAGLTAAGVAILLGLVSLQAPGLASALLILLLGFAAGNRILAALGILSLLGFLAHFYYSLQASLLEKSAILAVTGFCLLAGHFILRRSSQPPATVEASHA